MAQPRTRSLLPLLLVALFTLGPTTGCRGSAEDQAADAEVRDWYNAQVSTIPAKNEQWIAEGLSAEERAHRAYEIRHQARRSARERMTDKGEVEALRARDQAKYGDPDGPTFEYLVKKNQDKGLEGDAVYEAIVESSSQTNNTANRLAGGL